MAPALSPEISQAVRISVVLVSFNSASELRRTLPPLVDELSEGDELIVVDNGSMDDTRAAVAELAPAALFLELGSNTGFAAAADAGARHATGDLLVVLNPDAETLPGWGEGIRRPLVEGRDWDAWQSLVVCEGGRIVNTRGNPVHFAGFAWAGGHGEPVPERLEPTEVAAASGACLAIPLGTWRLFGGFPEEFFLYQEDIDLSMRIRLAGGRVGLEPSAVVDHDYEFGGLPEKWRWLERNRWAFMLRVYPGALLVPLVPALIATEMALIPVSLAGGWGRQKLLANLDVLRRLPGTLAERREIQASRRVSPRQFADILTPDLDSPFFGKVGRNRAVRTLLRGYWRAVRMLLPG